jgi:hypothetical protein
MQKHELSIWKRNSHLRWKCSLLNQISGPENEIRLYHWKNLNYCKIPKAGSTYWMQIFMALENEKNMSHIFGQNRFLYHSHAMTTVSWRETSAADVIFHFTRNPYSRLFSAYVDKVFLPGYEQLTTNITKKIGKPCNQSVTFEEFLKYIFVYYANEPHWQPISTLCSSCTVPYNVIGKQETFNQDVLFIFDQLDISHNSKQHFFKNLQEKHRENTIQEITKDMAVAARKSSCMTFSLFVKKLWKSFQIQGIISDSIPFPVKEFSSLNFDEIDSIVETYLNATRKTNMTEIMSKDQRQRHLARAFASVSTETLQVIRKTYKNDFEIFGYSYELPTMQ